MLIVSRIIRQDDDLSEKSKVDAGVEQGCNPGSYTNPPCTQILVSAIIPDGLNISQMIGDLF